MSDARRSFVGVEVYDLGEDFREAGFNRRYRAAIRRDKERPFTATGESPWEAVAHLAVACGLEGVDLKWGDPGR